MTERAIELLEEQQRKVKERSAPWMVAEQLKEICRREPHSAEILTQDLENASKSITEAEKKIKAYADMHKTGSFACVTPAEADAILREFYGPWQYRRRRAGGRQLTEDPQSGGLSVVRCGMDKGWKNIAEKLPVQPCQDLINDVLNSVYESGGKESSVHPCCCSTVRLLRWRSRSRRS